MSSYTRTVTTGSGAKAVHIVISETSDKKTMQHIGSAHSDHELALLKAQAKQILDDDQMSLGTRPCLEEPENAETQKTTLFADRYGQHQHGGFSP